jgi:biofilm PGA synthesis N-glycosyltransferase PgaC
VYRYLWTGATLLVALLLLVPYFFLVEGIPAPLQWTIGAYLLVLSSYVVWSCYVTYRRPTHAARFSVVGLTVALLAVTVGVVALGWVTSSTFVLLEMLYLFGLILVVAFWVVVAAAVYHFLSGRDVVDSPTSSPSVSVIVPAYNEADYVTRTIESILASDYPAEKRQLIVVDDGSTDETYEEAAAYRTEGVVVVQKENGGKYSALNYGLLFARNDIVVNVDADSLFTSTTLHELVAPLADPTVGAVAGNVKVDNRDSVVTGCQALEYVFNINVYRRAFDLFGLVPIVPGCVGAYRRSVLEDVHGYDPSTLTEDFDTTIKILKAGYKVRASPAVAYTEGPDTWTDLYYQRLRWYRGNLMTLFKHANDLMDPKHGLLHRLVLPLKLVEMLFLPLAGWVVLGLIVYGLFTVHAATILSTAAAFVGLVMLAHLLGIFIEHEDLRLVMFSPLLLVGYKQFLDVVLLKSLFDVLRRDDLEWTSPRRVRHKSQTSTAATGVDGGTDFATNTDSD